MLASPHYGERWARHWLDVAHYGETHGYDKDKRRPDAWPYRDYVIRSFNDDKPYDKFVVEQLAGDVLEPDVADGIIATGFVVSAAIGLQLAQTGVSLVFASEFVQHRSRTQPRLPTLGTGRYTGVPIERFTVTF